MGIIVLCKHCKEEARTIVSRSGIVPFEFQSSVGDFGFQIKPKAYIEEAEVTFMCQKCAQKQSITNIRWDSSNNKIFFDKRKLLLFQIQESEGYSFRLNRKNTSTECQVVYECRCTQVGTNLPTFCPEHHRPVIMASKTKLKFFMLSREEGEATHA